MRKREWIRCTEAERMLQEVAFLPTESNERRVRLFILTAGRHLWGRIDEAVFRQAVELAWRHAEGTATAEEVAQTYDALGSLYESACSTDSWEVARLVHVLAHLFRAPYSAAIELIRPISLVSPGQPIPLLTPEETKACCELLREIFGDRGHPATIDRALLTWNNSLVVRLAQTAYEERQLPSGIMDSGQLAVLADALEEAGCRDTEMLGHLRGPGPHWRGCFVIDAVLVNEPLRRF